MKNHKAFTSILNINLDEEMESGFDKRRVHVLYGMSKDFCANGFRCGRKFGGEHYSMIIL